MKKEIWNKGVKVGQKPPLSPEQVQLLKLTLSQVGNIRDIALFSLAIDSSLRGVDLVKITLRDLTRGGEYLDCVTIEQTKTREAVSFTLTPYTIEAIKELVEVGNLHESDYIFTSQRKNKGKPISVAHYRRLVRCWFDRAGINSKMYGSHSLRRTKLSYIYKKTGNLRAVQVLGGHKSITNTARYLGVDTADALELAKKHNIL